ncbi:ribulokinase [Lachnospiraceae bacterium JLR.KK008]
MEDKFVVGVDFGSDSVRATIVSVASGTPAGGGTALYPRWAQGLYQHPEQSVFRQHPLDYLESLEKCVKEAVACLSQSQKSNIIGIGVDTTGSTPVPVDREGVPLALKPQFAECENAMFQLWKDKSAVSEAEEIDRLFAHGSDIDYGVYQGKYCAEWFWAKILHTIRQDEKIKEAAYTWTEHCDWMVGLLCGDTRPETIYHSACAAGHKALWHSKWNGLPSDEILSTLDPYLTLVKERYGNSPQPAAVKAGRLTQEWADRLGLPEGIGVSGSSFDAHAGAVGAGIREKVLVCTIGTSAVDMLVGKAQDLAGKDIRSFGGQAENSILPDYVGIETGQAAFGDIFGWFKKVLMWPICQTKDCLPAEEYDRLCETMSDTMLAKLQKEAQDLPQDLFPISLDWFNGRRYPDTDDFQRGMIGGLTLGTEAPYLFRSLVFGAVCGLRRIVDGFEAAGIELEKVVAVGGISKKSEFVMQMMADVLGKKISILDADQTCALGAAVYAAVAGGAYETMQEASVNMAAKSIREFVPDEKKRAFYHQKYGEYLRLAMLADQWKE